MTGDVATILVAEDDPHVRAFVASVLSGLGYQIISARDGAVAADLAARCRRLDLVLTDVVMPWISGPDLVAHVRRTHPDVKVAFMSGFVPSEGLLEAVAPEAPLLQKPFTSGGLAQVVRAVLDGR